VFSVEAFDSSTIERRISSRLDVISCDREERKSRYEDASVNEQTLARARAGDGDAFRELTDPYRHELQLHIYRIAGSAQDAEDLLQETLLAAWRGLDQFQERASVRAWEPQGDREAASTCLGDHAIARSKRCLGFF
jgi:hypothetical protein